MKESSSYQFILKEGRQEGLHAGKLQALRETLLDILADRFGQISVEFVAQISLADDPLELRAAIRGANKVTSLAEFRLGDG